MDIKLKTNRTKYEPEHRLTLTVKEVRNYVFPRFKYFQPGAKFKMVTWREKGGLKLHYKNDGTTKSVGIEENGYGVASKYYTLDELESMMMPF